MGLEVEGPAGASPRRPGTAWRDGRRGRPREARGPGRVREAGRGRRRAAPPAGDGRPGRGRVVPHANGGGAAVIPPPSPQRAGRPVRPPRCGMGRGFRERGAPRDDGVAILPRAGSPDCRSCARTSRATAVSGRGSCATGHRAGGHDPVGPWKGHSVAASATGWCRGSVATVEGEWFAGGAGEPAARPWTGGSPVAAGAIRTRGRDGPFEPSQGALGRGHAVRPAGSGLRSPGARAALTEGSRSCRPDVLHAGRPGRLPPSEVRPRDRPAPCVRHDAAEREDDGGLRGRMPWGGASADGGGLTDAAALAAPMGSWRSACTSVPATGPVSGGGRGRGRGRSRGSRSRRRRSGRTRPGRPRR